MAQGKVSGRWVVIILFTGALLMWAIVLLTGYRQKWANRAALINNAAVDSASAPEAVRGWLKSLPQDWVKVTQVEGQGWVLLVPCYSSNGSIRIRAGDDSAPGIVCEYCDSLGALDVKSVSRNHGDSVWQLRIEPADGEVRIMPVTESLLKRFPEAPFKDRILVWTRGRAGGRVDSMIFAPKTQENEFETLRAEDENPEGCGGSDGNGPGENGIGESNDGAADKD
jgi:hypothetical protein